MQIRIWSVEKDVRNCRKWRDLPARMWPPRNLWILVWFIEFKTSLSKEIAFTSSPSPQNCPQLCQVTRSRTLERIHLMQLLFFRQLQIQETLWEICGEDNGERLSESPERQTVSQLKWQSVISELKDSNLRFSDRKLSRLSASPGNARISFFRRMLFN